MVAAGGAGVCGGGGRGEHGQSRWWGCNIVKVGRLRGGGGAGQSHCMSWSSMREQRVRQVGYQRSAGGPSWVWPIRWVRLFACVYFQQAEY